MDMYVGPHMDTPTHSANMLKSRAALNHIISMSRIE